MQMSPDLILDAISLYIGSSDKLHKKLIHDFIKIIDDNANGIIGVAESLDATSQLYFDVLKTIVNEDVDKNDTQAMLSSLLKFEASPIVQKDQVILTTLRELFSASTKLVPKKIEFLAKKLSNSLDLHIANKYIRKLFKQMVDCEQTNNVEKRSAILDSIVNNSKELVDVLLDNKNQLTNSTADRYLERINMNDKNDIKKAVKQYHDRTRHVFKTGLQGLNKMFGKLGGFKLGESITINALKHNYKSGLLMSFAKWIILHNKPYIDPCRPGIPTILFITLENEANENIMWWFESMYVATYGKPPEGLSDDEIVDMVYEFFQNSGYTLFIERKLGADFGYDEYVQMYERYQKTGHRILVTIIDYMNMMKKTSGGNTQGRSDLGLRDLYNKMCNFNKNHMTTQISAHQLNRDAARLAVGTTNVVKKFNDSHYADGMDVGREVDMEIFIHIERNNSGKPFLTMNRGKHRYVNDTPQKDKYTAYPFSEYGIIDDIDTENHEVKNIYSEDATEEDINKSLKDELNGHENTKVIDALF